MSGDDDDEDDDEDDDDDDDDNDDDDDDGVYSRLVPDLQQNCQEGFAPHRGDCSKFWVTYCRADQSSIVRQQSCPSGLHFDRARKVCDRPEDIETPCVTRRDDLDGLIFIGVWTDYLTVSWITPADLDITRYRLRYRHAGASHRDLSPPPAPGDDEATVPGLWAHTEYTLTLTAFGEDGRELWEKNGTETTAEVTVNVECHQDHMTVTFPRAALRGVNLADLHLLDPTCRPTLTEAEVTFRAGLQNCGTIQDSSEDDKFIFTNEAIGGQVTSDNGAVRGTPFRKRFQCEFLRQYVLSQGREILYNIPSPRVQVVDASNSLTFEMHIFTSADFTATYNSPDYPLQVTSSDQLHFGLSVDSPLDDLELFTLHCVATPSTDPEDSPSVSIIQDGCDIDPTLQLDSERSNDMASYYSIQSFTFPDIDDPSLVYIHCTMVVCFKSDPDSRCSQGCVPASRRRRAASDVREARVRRASERDRIATTSQGPFHVGNGQKEASPLPTVGIAVGAVAGIAGVLLLVAAVFLRNRRRRDDAKEQAEGRVGFDNYSFELWGKDKTSNAAPKPE
ncbi:CUZD1 [Branchiostoma lanceolatum]|uniref:chitinase n=1 Tax=Branchiostoma lanceolatum TaxID=7740 RepID=A0A8J9ZYR0_BRALA|nr:CUZD1 [Branchiostoma lanceolatum]